MTRRPLKIAVAIVLLLLAASAAEARGPSTDEEREQALKLVRLLESQPLSKDAKDARSWLVVWLTEIPDITVMVCPDLLGPQFDFERKHGTELMLQQTFSAAAFKIEHPDQANDEFAVNVASVEGVLRAYRALRAEKPKVKFQELEDLLQAQEAGELGARVEQNSKACHQ